MSMYPKFDVTNAVSTVYGYFNEKYSATWQLLIENLKAEFSDQVLDIKVPYSENKTDKVDLPTILVKKSSIISVLRYLKEAQGYSFLTDLTATDEDNDSPVEGTRFLMVYHLLNLENKARIRIKTAVAEAEIMPTAIPLWQGANWAEREVYDMFGIKFEGHPDLRRILMDVRFEGHPLRKDYPLRGYQVFLTPEPIDPELLK